MKSRYFLVKGEKKLHREDCTLFINKFSAITVGEFSDDQLALEVGRKVLPGTNACSGCMDVILDIPSVLEEV